MGCTSTKAGRREAAAGRARQLGLLPNELVWQHPLNRPQPTASHNLHSGPTGLTEPAVRALIASASGAPAVGYEALPADAGLPDLQRLAAAGKVDDWLSVLGCPTPALSPLPTYSAMRLPLAVALRVEAMAGPERPVARGTLGAAGLLSFHPSLYYVLSGRIPTMHYSGHPVDRLYGLAKLFGAISVDSPEDLASRGPFPSFPPIDRAGVLSNGLRCKVVWPIAERDRTFNLTLPEVMANRVRGLMSKRSQLHIMWSGGIDTTAILVAFLEQLGPEPERWRRAGCSVHYNQRFFERYVAGLPGGRFEGHVRDFLSGSSGAVVTGEPADMLFGTTWMSRAFKFEADHLGRPNPMWYSLEAPWERVLPEVLRRHGLLPEAARHEREWLEWIRPWVAAAPVSVVSVFDFCWWVAFALKWQHDMVRSFLNRGSVQPAAWEAVEHFYVTDEWQQYGYAQHEQKMLDKGVWSSYKWPLKKYIYDYTGDAEYFAAKIKVPSATYGFGYQLGLDDKLNSVCFGVLSMSRKRMDEKYGDSLQAMYLDESTLGVATTLPEKPNYLGNA